MNGYRLENEAISLTFKGEGKASKEHNDIIRDLVKMISEKYHTNMNYDHVYSTVMKTPVPLTYRGKRYDISFVYEGRVVFIQVDSEPYSLPEDQGSKRHAKSQG